MYVMTVDQRGSRHDRDRVDVARAALSDLPWVRPPDRTAGDELQAVADSADVVVTATLRLLGDGHWSVGIGVGPVQTPLPPETRAGRGAAFESAREAVTAAKSTPVPVQVRGTRTDECAHAEAILSVLGLIVGRRSPQGREVVELMDSGLTQTAAAERLGISKQAVSQRLSAAGYAIEPAARELARHLLELAGAP